MMMFSSLSPDDKNLKHTSLIPQNFVQRADGLDANKNLSLNSLIYQNSMGRNQVLQKLKGDLNKLDGEIEYYQSVTDQ